MSIHLFRNDIFRYMFRGVFKCAGKINLKYDFIKPFEVYALWDMNPKMLFLNSRQLSRQMKDSEN